MGDAKQCRQRHNSRKTSAKNFKVYKPPDTPMGPAGFVSLLRIQSAELIRRAHEHKNQKPTTAATADAGTSRPSTTASGATNVYRKGVPVNYHELLQVFNAVVDEDVPMDASVGQEGLFTLKHRHAIFAVQLFLYLALAVREVSVGDAILLLHKGMRDGAAVVGDGGTGGSDVDSVIPCDVDILLQSMHPGMVPALLSLELMRRVLEEEFRRVAFLKQIAAAHPNVADLQFLNVQFSGKFECRPEERT